MYRLWLSVSLALSVQRAQNAAFCIVKYAQSVFDLTD